MKRVVCIISLLLPLILCGQHQYEWRVPDGSWHDANSWSPQRVLPHSDDTLVFRETATVTGFPASEHFRALHFLAGSQTIFISNASALLHVSGNSGTPAIILEADAALQLKGSGSIILAPENGSSSSIAGSLIFEAGQHRFSPGTSADIRFLNGAIFRAGNAYNGPLYENTAHNSVYFEAGSCFINQSAADPFGAITPASVVVFESGSLYRHERAEAPDLNGRTYGHLEIAALTSFGMSLTQDLIIRNDLIINTDRFFFNPPAGNGHVRIRGSIRHNGGGKLQLGYTNWNGQIILEGSNEHTLEAGLPGGTIQFHNLTMNGGNLVLKRSLSLSGELSLNEGLIQTTATAPLTLLAGTTVTGPSTVYQNLPYPYTGSNSSYIRGPVTWNGLTANSKTVFPVGDNGLVRPIVLHNAQGNVTVEYRREDPVIDYNAHFDLPDYWISRLEYWNVSGINTNAQLEPSFLDPYSGIISYPSHTTVVLFENGIWRDAGNGGFTGTLKTNGGVRSLTAGNGRVALANKAVNQALAFSNTTVRFKTNGQGIRFLWTVTDNEAITHFQWLECGVAKAWKPWANIQQVGNAGTHQYGFEGKITGPYVSGYKLLIFYRNGSKKEYLIPLPEGDFDEPMVYPNPVHEKIFIFFPKQSSKTKINVVHINGTLLHEQFVEGERAEINVTGLKPGMYFIRFFYRSKNLVRSFIKQ